MMEAAVDLPKIHLLDEQAIALFELLKSSEYSSIFILCDSNTKKHCYPILQRNFEREELGYHLIERKAGEEHKNINTAIGICEELAELGADRHSLLINLGGGMICDLGGFCASIYKRGIDFIHLPTSLLAMVDASIGGKCGVDHKGLKNQLGVINQAKAIFILHDFLNTLEEEELKSGLAELYKHALISDSSFWNSLQELDPSSIDQKLILRGASLKEDIVRNDPFEKGERKLLNFGHNIGHAIESYFIEKGSPIPHGFAVAAGMVAESYISEKSTGLAEGERKEIERLIKKVYPKLNWSQEDQTELISYLKHDKKNKGGKLIFTLLRSIGDATYDQEVKEKEVLEALNYYRNEF